MSSRWRVSTAVLEIKHGLTSVLGISMYILWKSNTLRSLSFIEVSGHKLCIYFSGRSSTNETRVINFSTAFINKTFDYKYRFVARVAEIYRGNPSNRAEREKSKYLLTCRLNKKKIFKTTRKGNKFSLYKQRIDLHIRREIETHIINVE